MAYPNGLTVIEQPALNEPVLIVMLSGWIDAASAAAGTMAHIERQAAARTIARFEPDLFIDYRARRPVMELRDGVSTTLVWPSTELKVGTDDNGRDGLLLTGYEPDANWQYFAKLVADLADSFAVTMMVGLGAYPFATPHSRPSRLSCTTPSAELAASVNYLRNSVDVPAGVATVIEHVLHARSVPAIGLWAQVPHYISTMAYPAASVALLEGLGAVSGVVFAAGELVEQAQVQRQRLDELVQANSDHVAMLRQLEVAYDAMAEATDTTAALDASTLPSGEELAAEVERFLREQGS
jgi:hypothetical protein